MFGQPRDKYFKHIGLKEIGRIENFVIICKKKYIFDENVNDLNEESEVPAIIFCICIVLLECCIGFNFC